MIQPLWRTVWRFLRKLKIELPYDPAIPLLGIYPEKIIIQKESWGFPGGAVVEGLPANAGDTGLSPGLGRSHMPRSNWAREPQFTEPARLEPVLRNKRGHDSERPTYRDEEWPLLAATRESPHTETKTQQSHK